MSKFPGREHQRLAVMTQELLEHIDYEVCGSGPTVVLVPGSCSTGAAWRPLISAWDNRRRCVTTSLLGYGKTAERRTTHDTSISHEADALEWVIRRASGGGVHLVGHSFGGLVALAVALRNRVRLASLVIIEAPAVELLRERAEQQHYRAFRHMTEAYFAAYESGGTEAIPAMIDFYGGAGTFTSWPPRVRAYAVQTTAVNILDWASAYGFPLSAAALAIIEIPTLVLRGGASHPAMQRVNGLLFECMNRAALATIEGAAHFMIATHAGGVAHLIGEHVDSVESRSISRTHFCDRNRPEKTMAPTQKIRPAFRSRSSRQLFLCPITNYPCEGDLSYLCEDYGCARKGGLSPRSDENS
jgi:pimeloyl-ACP methyl ester carboxylesterase